MTTTNTPRYDLQFISCGGPIRYTSAEEDMAIQAANEVIEASKYTAIEAYEAWRAMYAEEPHDSAAAETWRQAEVAALNAGDEAHGDWFNCSHNIEMTLSIQGDTQ